MAPLPFTLVPVNPRNLMSIDPKNWRRYPSVPVPVGGSKPVYVPNIVSTTGAANIGATSDNNGETGTISVTRNADAPYADTGDYVPKTQAARAAAANLTPGTTIAPDIGKSYHGDRGAIEHFKAYPVGAGKPTDALIPDAFKPAALLEEEVIP